jgi:hypothetical protein
MDPLAYRILATIALAITTLFIGLFARQPWWRHPFGQSVMLLAAGLWLYEAATVLRQWLGADYAGRDFVRYVAQVAVLVAMGERTFELIRDLIRRRKR